MNRFSTFEYSVFAAITLATGVSLAAENEVDFSREVLPILSENCFHCHGPDAGERKAKLRLDTDGWGQSLEGKEIVERTHSADPDEVMPPGDSVKSLTDAEKKTLQVWISSGAKYEAHWAFQPIQQPDPSATIDGFITAALKEKELSLSPPLSKNQLIRRATFDLTGLPPTWAEVEGYENDQSPDAFEKVIDRLLTSPAYGERWGRHWLDLARYADTHGGSAIGFKRFPFSYTYRDYVISAFNADLPYDQFVLEQIAADQLKLDENDPAHAGLGFLTVGRQFRNVHDRVDDQIDVISRGLLGLTVSCARCHDHKFDPIPTADYYSLYATLASSRVPEELPVVGNPEVDDKYETELAKRERARDDITREQELVFQGRLRMQAGLYLKELAKGTPEQDTSTFFLSYRTDELRPVVLERWRVHLKKLDGEDPVFGPWHRLSKIEADDFENKCAALVAELIKENGDPKKFANEHQLATNAPKWNPRVLDILASKKPKSFVEVAGVYGDVFAEAHRRWLTSLLEASIEAGPGGKIVADQDAKHRVVNSAIERQLRHHLYDPESPTSVSMKEGGHVTMLNRGVRDRVGATRGAIETLNGSSTAPPRAMILSEAEEPNEAFVFLRGNPIQRGDRVIPAFLTALSPKEPAPFSNGQRRFDLAKAIVDPENQLTRRVIANWIWQHHFGRGLVRTSDDFGTRGDPPSHPELLDYLATKFLGDKWSIKQMHRRIMLSKAYQQASVENAAAREKDPLNQLLWRMPPRKLGMEAMRDSLLAVSGELDRKPGGQPFDETETKTVPRRSVYAFLNRDVISAMAATFDGADPSSCTVKRQETMVPQQTLFALNSDFIRDRANALVALPDIQKAKSDEEKVRLIYQHVYSRAPDSNETTTALKFLKDADAGTWLRFAHALLASNEFHFVD
ncbi:MAG: PSD1 and planctomycete cytochrome C domain-containing protein [Verrucomicrobiales bacterium]